MKSVWQFAGVALAGVNLWAQPAIRLKTGPVETRGGRMETRAAAARHHWILQFAAFPGADIRTELARRGMRVLQYVPDFALAVAADERPALDGLGVRWAGWLTAEQKISPLVRGGEYDTVVVSFQPDANMERARESVAAAGLVTVEQAGLLPNHLLVTGPPDRLNKLAGDDDVAYVFPAGWELRLRRPQYRCGGVVSEAGPVADYALEGPGWSKDAAGQVALGYFFNSLTSKLDGNTVRTEIERALAEWEHYANVSFTPEPAAGGPREIDISFALGAHGDAYPFTGTAILAHTFFPAPPNAEPIAGDIHLNAGVNWQVGRSVDLFSVALHEAGHALGLAHSDNPSSVMYPYYSQSSGLSDDDIAAVQALYGARGAQAPQPPTPPPAPPSPPPSQPPSQPPAQPPAPPTNPAGSDTTPPSLAITSPGGTIVSAYASSIAVSGTAADNTGVVRVEWSNSNGGSGTAQGTTNWSATVPLLVGNNAITLRAYDAAGNSAWRSITVVRH